MKFEVKNKDVTRTAVGIIFTSIVFSVLPMLTIILPYSVTMVAVIGFATMLNVAGILYFAFTAPSQRWHVFQLILLVASLFITFGFLIPHPIY